MGVPPTFTTPPEAICVIRLSAIGDTCHTVPVVRAIQDAWPQTALTWIIGRTEHALLEGMGGVEFIVLDKSRGIRAYLDVRRRLAGRRFPLLLHMHASLRANLVSSAVKATTRLGFDGARARDYQWLFCNRHLPARPKQHVMDGLFEFADAIGVAHGEPRWDMPLTPADRAFAAGVLGAARPAVVISPCTGQRFRNYRNWRAERYAAVAEHASKAYGARIVLTGAGTALEREYAGTITALLSEPPVDLVGKTSLKQLLAVIERAALVVCPDSGPAHMATAVGTPVVGLYATSNRHRTGPYASQHLVVDKYPEAVRREFGKPVEALRWGERVRDPSAMDLIEVDEVKAKVDHALTARPATGSRSAHGDAAPAQARS